MDLSKLLLVGAENGVRTYFKMSPYPYAPEGFVRDFCAMELYKEYGIPVSTELSHHSVKTKLALGSAALPELRDFKIDLVTHSSAQDNPGIKSLIEFKLYTGERAASDIRRLQALVKAAQACGKQIEAYVVIAEQAYPHQGRKYVEAAFREFAEKFKTTMQQDLFELDHPASAEKYPVGICVIDVSSK